MIKFGPAGNSKDFYEEGYKSTVDAPLWLHNMGLDCYEYQCGNGIRVQPHMAKVIGVEAKKYGIALSIHSPYFISLASDDKEKRENSICYIIDTLKIADYMGATRIVVHPGGCGKKDRETAFDVACDTMKKAVSKAKSMGLSHINICPETMGKINQLGTLEEIVKMCKIDEMLIPTIDFGHLNARSMGGLKSEEDFEKVVNYLFEELGYERVKSFHAHFSKIEYTKGGEKKHLTFEDRHFGPDFSLLSAVLKRLGATPTIICESSGTMAKDALIMKKMYWGL